MVDNMISYKAVWKPKIILLHAYNSYIHYPSLIPTCLGQAVTPHNADNLYSGSGNISYENTDQDGARNSTIIAHGSEWVNNSLDRHKRNSK